MALEKLGRRILSRALLEQERNWEPRRWIVAPPCISRLLCLLVPSVASTSWHLLCLTRRGQQRHDCQAHLEAGQQSTAST